MTIQPQAYESLIEKLLDDRISEEELQRLNEVLRQSPEAREYYWHLAMLEGYLTDLPGWIAGQQYATQLVFSETLEAFIEMESNAEAQLQHYLTTPDSFAEDPTENKQVTWRDIRMTGAFCLRSLARQKATRGVAAAAVIGIAALVYATWFAGGPSHPASDPVAGLNQVAPPETDKDTGPKTPQDSEPVTPAPEPSPVALVLHHAEGAESKTKNTVPPGTQLAQGRVLELSAGDAVQLEYRSGVRAILQGPGAFEMLSPQRIGMPHGRISAVVPPEAKGFTVATKRMDFIDHGTEFAVNLNEQGHGDVAVLEGLIEVRQARTDAPEYPDQAEGTMLREGFGAALVPDRAQPESVQQLDESHIHRYTRDWDDVIYRPVFSGEISYTPSPPASLKSRQASRANPLLIPERRGVELVQDLALDANRANRLVTQQLGIQADPLQQYTIAAGTKLNSFLIHYDTFGSQSGQVIERDFKLRFRGRILGIIQVHTDQQKTDGLFGLESIQYPEEGSLRGAADPPGHPNFDVIWVSNDLRTLTVKMRLTGMDQIRVLVENTDP